SGAPRPALHDPRGRRPAPGLGPTLAAGAPATPAARTCARSTVTESPDPCPPARRGWAGRASSPSSEMSPYTPRLPTGLPIILRCLVRHEVQEGTERGDS